MSTSVDDTWAEEEFGLAELGDERRTKRLVELAERLGKAPMASLPDATGDTALLKAAYRFFGNEEIETQAILASHMKASYERMREQEVILAVQDSSLLDWTQHPATSGLGPLGTEKQQGLVMHSTLAVTPERLALGILSQEVWARDPATFNQLPDRRQRPIEDKESHKWLTGLAAANAARLVCPQTHFISVGDREADVYDLFLAERNEGVDLLVRATSDRRLDDPNYRKLRQAVGAEPVQATLMVKVPRQGDRPARQASLSLRFRPVTLRPPKYRADENLSTVKVWAVWVVELHPPADTSPLDWLLLTTIPLSLPEQAITCLEWYICRWQIEVWHKVLKTGCRIEARQLQSADHLMRCLALYSIIAWRILYATMLARVVPDLPCTLLLEEAEWKALYCALHQTPSPPSHPPSLRTAVRWIAQLGGFLGRAHDLEPGPTVLWKGFQHLSQLTTMYRILSPHLPKDLGKD
jgi:Transposase DNA-binding/Transposase Tn5 dimerisation domain